MKKKLDNVNIGTVIYRNADKLLTVGRGMPVRINVSVGLSDTSERSINNEREKVVKILNYKHQPDLIMDLSIMTTKWKPWQFLLDNFNGAVGILPHYEIFNEKFGINENELLDRIHLLFDKGISFITIHASPTIELFEIAKETRKLPVTSRGGGIVIRDMLINKRKENVYAKLFEQICKLAFEKGVIINLGTTFRSSNISEGMDIVSIEELKSQKKMIDRAHALGTQVVLEGPGHLILSKIDDYVDATKSWHVPLMPLGPIVSDNFPGLDHFTSAIGAAYMMTKSKGGIINAMTRIEHTGGVPQLNHIIEALDVARVAAHSATITYNPSSRLKDYKINKIRSEVRSCIASSTNLSKTKEGCSRCGSVCPLIPF